MPKSVSGPALNRAPLFVLTAFAPALIPLQAIAADTLPVQSGSYYSGSPGDCGGPAAMTWDGHKFLADYVYIDNIVSVKKLANNDYRVTSNTKTSDENTQKNGMSWIARVKILGPGRFSFNQYSAKGKMNPRETKRFTLCKR